MPISSPFSKRKMKTDELASSFTDDGVFPASCREIANDRERFERFRREPAIVRAIEHVSFWEGQVHLDSILSCRGCAREVYLGLAKKNDQVGSPVKYEYSPYGWYSPKTLEYVRIAHELTHIFGALADCEIFEIGGGYGGQALVLAGLFSLRRYTILDLPDVLALQRRYHAAQGLTDVTYLSAPDQVRSRAVRPSHLLISNFAFAECRKDVQEAYLIDILAHAERGYMACNFVMKRRKALPLIGKYALLRKVKRSYYVDESPEFHLQNRVLLWDRLSADKGHSLMRAVFGELQRDCRVMPRRLRAVWPAPERREPPSSPVPPHTEV